MTRFIACLFIHSAAWLLNWFIAPVYSLFTANGWPKWGYWLITPDNPLPVGDRQYMREGAPFIGIGHTGFKGWVNRTFWLYRNPVNGLAYSLLGFEPSVLDNLISVGNKRVGDKRKVEGLFSQYVYRNGKLYAFQHYYVKKWSETKCFRARIGWKLSSWPYPKVPPKYQFVFAVTVWKSYG